MSYRAFLESKRVAHDPAGILIDPSAIPGCLFPFQASTVAKALEKGRYAIWADTGLGKMRMELVWGKITADHTGKPCLILCPLAVGAQIIEEARLIGVDAGPYCSGSQIQVINYDRLKDVEPDKFGSVVLDESSILKNFAGIMRAKLTGMFATTPYRLAATATPAPNDHTELGNHAEFLGVMTRTAMLSRWFVHDSGDTSEWRLKGHAKEDFWRWVSSWAVAYRKPSDIGFEQDGYELPHLTIDRHVADGDSFFVSECRLSATGMHAQMRTTADVRAARVAELVMAEPDEQWIIWCNTDYEAKAIRAVLPDVVEVAGSMSVAVKESRLMGFAHGEVKWLLSKPSIAGHGLNFQSCARMTFMGLSYSYEGLYQAIRRCWRYGQKRPVHAHVVTAQAEWSILDSIDRKREDHERMVAEMVKLMGQGEEEAEPNVISDDTSGKGWRLLGGDCVERLKGVPDESIGYSVFSPPFASLYTYTDSPEDMGNCAGHAEFFDHFKFLAPELYRVMMPGRLLSFHCMDLPLTKERDGLTALHDFPGDLIRVFKDAGFFFHSRVTIWKDPVTAMQRTKAIGLLYKQLKKDSAKSRQGIADYVITMGKPGVNPDPVTKDPEAFPVSMWQEYASPVWMDVDQTRVLPFRGARGSRDDRHICPLQLDVIERCIDLWTKPGDMVLDPFNGIGSTGYVALQRGRSYVGIELKESYFKQAVLNLGRAVSHKQERLFEDDPE